MGKKNLKNLKKNGRTGEDRDFKSMSDKIMSEVNDNHKKPVEYSGEKDHPKNRPDEKRKRPNSKVNEFVNMMSAIASDFVALYKSEGLIIQTTINRSKESNGIITAKVEFLTDNGNKLETSSTLLLHYIENRSISFRDSSRFESYPAHLTLFVQPNGKILFNRFGSATDVIEKSESYIRNILDNGSKFLLPSSAESAPKTDAVEEVTEQASEGTEPVE